MKVKTNTKPSEANSVHIGCYDTVLETGRDYVQPEKLGTRALSPQKKLAPFVDERKPTERNENSEPMMNRQEKSKIKKMQDMKRLKPSECPEAPGKPNLHTKHGDWIWLCLMRICLLMTFLSAVRAAETAKSFHFGDACPS